MKRTELKTEGESVRASRLSIRNFRNFQAIDVPLAGNVVLLGENRCGKTNLIFAVRLVLDPTLPDSARGLKLSDFWDGADLAQDPQIEVHLDFAEFDDDDALVALLTDFRLASDPKTARLSYIYRKRTEVSGPPRSSADCEFIVFGGGDETRSLPNRVRRRIALDMLDALRDAEGQLASWRNSPLRHLLDDAVASVSRKELDVVAADLDRANKTLADFPSIRALENTLRSGILDLAGHSHDIDARLRFAPADPQRLFRSIAMFIDGGKRGLAEASLGSANVALVALKLAEFAWRRKENERNYSLLCIEEPEAHLHPQLQRAVFDKLFRGDPAQALFVTSHSPTLAATAPLRSVVQLRASKGATRAYSLASLPVTAEELDDIEHYLNATRAELLFARGAIFVEGDAEETLLPVFAEAMGHQLDRLGITICNVAGTNFAPYVKLAACLSLPYAVVTDWDPLDGSKPALGRARALDLFDAACAATGRNRLTIQQRARFNVMSDESFRATIALAGFFLNEHTFETSIASTATLLNPLLDVLGDQGFGPLRTSRIAAWRSGAAPLDPAQMLAMVADIGKGRLSARLAKKLGGLPGLAAPPYIASALNYMVPLV